ncbi:ubiquinone biosynthesis coq-4 mitochondrial [Fusarium albosuccineum]|uniref:4-hydroxy-3-methoxy-5-polyprenylbenzoate decarboxylase n=1 Tax=Fusarium albosuccineum TaxID=1237068 RepID=A0A8H4LHI5_9HYPO|nr:ubiquinone biosynthesis coq-4 mitochondrial [Fusarium albosuccineum]
MPLVFKQSLRAERWKCPPLHSLILYHTPHVRKVDCKFDPGAEKLLPWILGGTPDECQELDGSATTSHANQLPDLEELRLTAMSEGYGKIWSIQEFEALFFHPNLKILRLDTFDWTQDVAEMMQWSNFTCNLRRLDMEESFIDGPTMRYILIYFKSLESLSIQLHNYDPAESDHYLSLDEFGDALRELGHNLAKFDLRTREFAIKWGLPGEIGPLQSLKSLQHLTISSEDLLSSVTRPDGRIRLADTLPPSLETLELLASHFLRNNQDPLYDVQDQIHELITGGFVPNLRNITLWKYLLPMDPKFELDIQGWDIDEEDAWGPKADDRYIETKAWLSHGWTLAHVSQHHQSWDRTITNLLGLRTAMEAALPRLRSIGSARPGCTLLRVTSCASCSSSSSRNFSVLNRPPPNYPGHVPLTKVERAGLAIGASVMSFFDPYRHDLIAATGEATATPYFIYRLRDAMLTDPTGRRILRARPRISSKTLSLTALRALPEDTVGRAYVGWLDREGVSPDTRASVRYIDDEECAYVMQRYRECHDFYHALTGLPIVREGEVALKAFEFANTLLPMTGLSIFAAATMKRSERQRFASIYLPWALKNGARSKEVINVFWEERLEDDVDDLRKELGIERPPDMRTIRKRERAEKKRLKELREGGF